MTTSIVSSLPKPWEHQPTFNDVLYDWTSRAPWLAISAGAHVLVVLITAAIPWEYLSKDPPKNLLPEETFEDPPPEEPPEIVEEEPLEVYYRYARVLGAR